jgi:hypothetical protein
VARRGFTDPFRLAMRELGYVNDVKAPAAYCVS